MVSNFENDSINFKEKLPLLPVRDIVVYPFMILPLFVGREGSIQAVEESLNNHDRLILLSSQKDMTTENPEPSEIYDIGTVAMIMRMRKLPDGRIKILIQGLSKVKITNFHKHESFYKVNLEKLDPINGDHDPIAVEALIRNVREQLERAVTLGKVMTPDLLMVLEDIHEPGRLADLIASNLDLKVSDSQDILETLDPVERLHKIDELLGREIEILSVQARIKNVAKDEISKTQKEYFLREQIKAIKNELGDEGQEHTDEFLEIREKILKAKMPTEVENEALKQLSRLEKMHPDSSESSILRNYLELLTELPWNITTEENLDLHHAKKILDEDHFELEKVKERILEYLAVRSLKGKNIKGPILCFFGPPGVGKTSLGKSIARAIGRNFVRISLGGIRDEAEIRGHRRTYVGAMPGRFIQALKQVKSKNPVLLLDEIDKMGADFRGDPASALLEILDPEQNYFFRDHYLNVNFDLSQVIFIATANNLDNVPHPLRDRLEIIHLPGYTQEEKVAISVKYLIPKQMEENGVAKEFLKFSKESISHVIKNFTYEAGLRNLERQIGSLCRKVAKKIASGNKETTLMTPVMVEDLLGPPIFSKEDKKEHSEVGVATGLAWTPAGGEILHIEATKMRGKGLTLTGYLGDVMKESAHAAIGHIRSHAVEFGIDEDDFDRYEIHVHIPAGNIPKDGPSAGITLATAIISLLTGCPVNKEVAMTGEITLTGKILPIGGIKEKALAAMRVGIKTIILPIKNKKDLVEIPEEYHKKINFITASTLQEVLEEALIGWKKRNVGKKSGPKSKKKSGTGKKRRKDSSSEVAA